MVAGEWPPGEDEPTEYRLSTLPVAFLKVTDRAAPPIRPERHVTNPIATVRRAIAVHLARTRPRCPSRAAHVAQGEGKGQVDSEACDTVGLERFR